MGRSCCRWARSLPPSPVHVEQTKALRHQTVVAHIPRLHSGQYHDSHPTSAVVPRAFLTPAALDASNQSADSARPNHDTHIRRVLRRAGWLFDHTNILEFVAVIINVWITRCHLMAQPARDAQVIFNVL